MHIFSSGLFQNMVEELKARKISRRAALSTGGKIAITAVVAGVVAGVGGYLAGSAAAPTVTKTVAGGTQTVTVTSTAKTTVTAAGRGLSGEIPIGAIYPNPEEAGYTAPGVKLGIEDANKFCEEAEIPVKFVLYEENAEESATKAVERLQALHSRGCQVVIAPNWSSQCKAMLKYANENKVVLISPGSTSPAIAIPDDYLFRIPPTDEGHSYAVRKVAQELGIKAAIIAYGKEAYAEGVFRAVSERFKEAGIEIFYSIGLDPEKKEFVGEFSTISSKYDEALKKYKPEEIGIFLFGVGSCLVTQLISLGKYPNLLEAKWVFDSDSGGSPEITEHAGDVAAKVGFMGYSYAIAKSPKADEFKKRFKEMTGFEPWSWSQTGYDAAYLAALTILLAGEYKGEKIKKLLPAVADNYYGVSGWCRLNEAGDRAITQSNIWRVNENKEWEVVAFYDGVTDTLQWFKKLK